MKMYWAIKIIDDKTITETKQNILAELTEEVRKGVPRTMSNLAYLKRVNQAFGPFHKMSHATAMAPSDLDELGIDFFGSKWAMVELPMIYKEFDEPIWTVKKVYVCSKSDARTETDGCSSHQRFPGSCSECKSAGMNLVPTVQVRDWDGRYS